MVERFFLFLVHSFPKSAPVQTQTDAIWVVGLLKLAQKQYFSTRFHKIVPDGFWTVDC
jgi:hypothetical protein